MSQFFVRSSGAAVRIAQRNPGRDGPRLRIMRSRFPTDRRASWRERFLAIARQADPSLAAAAPEPGLPSPRVRDRLGLRPAVPGLHHRVRATLGM